MNRLVNLIILLVITVSSSSAEVAPFEAKDPNFYFGPNGRLELKKPDTWHFMNPDDMALQAELSPLKGARFLQFVKDSSPTLLVAASKYMEPVDVYNPHFEVGLLWNDYEDFEPVDLMQIELEKHASQLPDFEVLEPIKACEIAGLPAARGLFGYSTKGLEWEVLPLVLEQFIVPRGKYMYSFIFVGRSDGPEALVDTVTYVLETVRFFE